MLCRKYGVQPNFHIAAGALCLAVGIVADRFSRGIDWNGTTNAFSLSGDFIQGFLTGLGIVLICASIPLNLLAFRRSRQARSDGEKGE